MRVQIFTLLLVSGITPVVSAMEGQPQPASINIPVAGYQTLQFPPFPPGTPVTINIIAQANPTQSVNVNNSNTQSQGQGQKQEQEQEQRQQQRIYFYNILPEHPFGKSIDALYDRIVGIGKYKRYIIGTALAYGYGKTFKTVAQANRYLKDEKRWGNWKKHLTYKELITADRQKLIKDMVIAIQQQYISLDDPMSIERPLQTFMKKIAREEEHLQYYHQLYIGLHKVYMHRLFPFDNSLFACIPMQLERIAYIKRIFSEWLTAYKIEQGNLLMRRVMQIDD